MGHVATEPEQVGVGTVVVQGRSASVGDEEIRSAKDRLVQGGLLRNPGPDWLPGEIDRSWRRSVSAGAARAPGAARFVNEFDADSELARAARPVLDRLENTLQDMGTAIFLADRTGQIVGRRITGARERALFDDAGAAEGFDFSEGHLGTNGLGTPMEEGGSLFVRGAQHFNEALEHIACAGVGIRHPVTGRLVGSLSLAAPADTAEMLMLALAKEGAQQVVDNLGAVGGRHELALGRSYRSLRTKGPVIVLNRETVMTNVTGLSYLNVEAHALLWDTLLAQDWSQGAQLLELDLPALRARVLAHRLEEAEQGFAVEIVERRRESARRQTTQGLQDPRVLRLEQLVARAVGVISVTGPGGAGKMHVVRQWLGRRDGPVLEVDAADLPRRPGWRDELAEALESGTVVVLRHVEDLAPDALPALRFVADRADASATAPLIVTADLERCAEPVAGLLARSAVAIVIAPLAGRREEIPALVRALLDDVEPARRPVLSSATVQALTRAQWPGNVAELRHVLLVLADEHPGSSVSPHHLPERLWETASRRSLTRIESAERAEILTALRQTRGNRSQAAALLGIGRTTLYRKLRTLGVDDGALLE